VNHADFSVPGGLLKVWDARTGRGILLVLVLSALLSACQSVSMDGGPALCLSDPGGVTPAISCTAPAASAAGAPAEPAAPRPDQTGARNSLVLPPFLRDGVDITAAVPAARNVLAPSVSGPSRRAVSLHDAVMQAALSHPEIAAAGARVREARAGISIAESGLYPQGDVRVALGAAQSGNSGGKRVFDKSNPDGNARMDTTLSMKQLLYDFGATRLDTERATYVRDAEKLRLMDKIDDIVLKTAHAYLKILESRALLGLVDETITAHRRLAGIVQANQKEGNGTAADVNRVSSRLTDIQAIRSDVSLQMMGAEEQFMRLTRINPGALSAAPDLSGRLPASPAAAIAAMRANSPRLGALSLTARASEKEIESQRAGQMPKVQLEVDGDTKNYAALNRNRNEAEARAMIAVRYRFMDGGLATATEEQLSHRRESTLHMLRNEDEQTSADIRQAYRAVDSARRKERLVGEGVLTSRKVQELYLEQFKAGRRTVFELLDSQMSSFTVRRSEIESRFERQKAVFEILRNSGRLAEAMSRATGSGAIGSGASGQTRHATVRPKGPARAGTSAADGAAESPGDVGNAPATWPVSPARMPKRIPDSAVPR
jgi:outer membrane protein, adhesin transport system